MILNKIQENNSRINGVENANILLLHEEWNTQIGDFCKRVHKLRYIKTVFKNASLDINFSGREAGIYEDLLKNNPHLNRVSYREWEEIDFGYYDIIFCISKKEGRLLDLLSEKYAHSLNMENFKLAVFSMSMLLYLPGEQVDLIFPANESLVKNTDIYENPGELYIDREEQEWGTRWLKSKGVEDDETLFILLDSTTSNDKLLKVNVYFEYLEFILKMKNIKVLNFDEKRIGKEEFYKEWLDPHYCDKIIFSTGLSLREALCIIGSEKTKFIFGPCTGLMHCASSIYNNYVHNGMPVEDVPLMITYTGRYRPGSSANGWWGNSPLINCLLIKEINHKQKIYQLDKLNEKERSTEDSLPCSAYSAEMLIEYTNKLIVHAPRFSFLHDVC
jgi:hypothetical protein